MSYDEFLRDRVRQLQDNVLALEGDARRDRVRLDATEAALRRERAELEDVQTELTNWLGAA